MFFLTVQEARKTQSVNAMLKMSSLDYCGLISSSSWGSCIRTNAYVTMLLLLWGLFAGWRKTGNVCDYTARGWSHKQCSAVRFAAINIFSSKIHFNTYFIKAAAWLRSRFYCLHSVYDSKCSVDIIKNDKLKSGGHKEGSQKKRECTNAVAWSCWTTSRRCF